jgi:cation/acetate symporter
VAGLTISASTSFAHDFYTAVIHKGTERRPGEEVRVARIPSWSGRSPIAILLSKDANVAFLVALAFAVAASAIAGHSALTFWKRFNTLARSSGLPRV